LPPAILLRIAKRFQIHSFHNTACPI
jgi:hypothetical protein